jgi:hypothetical protein|tara:strand:+ start:219 stop:506 length:288 start_codon:yes stop_codon:yes gene_type:complete
MNREIYNIVLVHTSREWERVRVTQPHQEMPYDNIGSVDEIESIASRIYYNDVMQGFIKAENRDEYWIKNTSEGMSDSYIESEANRIITNEITLQE